MPFTVVRRGNHVEVEGATTEQVKTAMVLLGAAQDLQYEHACRARDQMLKVMVTSHVDLVPPASVEQARRLAQHRAGLLTTPVFTYETLGELRGDRRSSATRTWVARQRAARNLFTVTDQGRTLIPAFQLDDSGVPRSELLAVLSALLGGGVDGWELWTWLTSATPVLSGDIPERVVGTNPDRVLRAAEQFVARR